MDLTSRSGSIFNGNRYANTHPNVKNITAFPFRLFPTISRVSPKVIHINITEIIHKGEPNTSTSVPINPTIISDKCDHALIIYPVGSPSECTKIRVIKRIFIGGHGTCCICVFDMSIQGRILQVSIKIIGTILPR